VPRTFPRIAHLQQFGNVELDLLDYLSGLVRAG